MNDERYEKIFGNSKDNETGTPPPSMWIQLWHIEWCEWHWFLKTEVDDPSFPKNEYSMVELA
jgi:hypothetical protein